MDKNKQLKSGFSTGTCVTACAKATGLLFQKKNIPKTISILFPDKKYRNLQLLEIKIDKNSIFVSIKKDAGDDPDVTNKAIISCELRKCLLSEKTEKDYLIKIGKSSLIIRGGEGVGLSTRNGLDCPNGKWAINSGPLKMIEDNLKDIDFGKIKNDFILVIRIKNGQKLARKTLNSTLGIIDGLSVLGTTGIVYPHSHAAYIEVIKIHIRSLALSDYQHIVLSTGNRTEKSIKQKLPTLPDNAFIRIADYIFESLQIVDEFGFNSVTIACMPGKLFKYACGYKNTHANSFKLDPKDMIPMLENKNIKINIKIKTHILNSVLIKEALEVFSTEDQYKIIEIWKTIAIKNFKNWTPNIDVKIHLIFA